METLARLGDFQLAALIIAVIWLGALTPSVLWRARRSGRATLRNAVIWIAIFAMLYVVYALFLGAPEAGRGAGA